MTAWRSAIFSEIGVIAVGGAGGAILSNLAGKLPHLARTIAINLDPGGLAQVEADRKILVGTGRGHGAACPSSPDAARQLALAIRPQLAEATRGLDMAFVLAGLGGATGTGIAPLVAQILAEQGTTPVGAAFTPFGFEASERQQRAQAGLAALARQGTPLFAISNDVLAQAAGSETPLPLIFEQATETFERLYRGLALPMGDSSLIGVDPEDIRHILSRGPCATLGHGSAHGPDRSEQATRNAIEFPLLGRERLKSAAGLLITIETDPGTLKMREVNRVVGTIRDHVDMDTDIVFATGNDRRLGEGLRVSIIAVGTATA